MGKLSNVVATILVAVQILILPAVSPAVAISVELAKKCREMAIKAHPPPPKGPKAYAQAERYFFNQCVAANGQMEDTNPQGDSHSRDERSRPNEVA